MAEFVEFRCEEWIAELEKLERIRLFESQEIKSLAQKRREFEYKLERRCKKKEDFLKYIQYEVNLLRVINARRTKTGINTNKREIEHRQIARILRLFKQVIFRFSEDVKLWMSLFQFCHNVNQHSMASKMLGRMLQTHSNKIDLWEFAANWELNHNNSIGNARQYLTKGLRHHPLSEKLYLELFKLELEHMKKKIKVKELKLKKNSQEPDPVLDSIINGDVVIIVYKSAIKVIPHADFKVDLLNICLSYEKTDNIQNKIICDLVDSHSNEEITWVVIAKREFCGLPSDWSNEYKLTNFDAADSDVNSKVMGKLRQKLLKSISVYEEATKRLNTPKMWNHYLDHIMNIYNDKTIKSKLPVFTLKLVGTAMDGALNSGNISEKHMLEWIKILYKSGKLSKKLEETLAAATERFPKSLSLWSYRLKLHLSQNDSELGTMVFKDAIKNIPDKPFLWKLILHYYQLKNLPDVAELFKDGICQQEVAKVLKPLYIEWLVSNRGIAEMRKIVETIEFQHPPSLEIYKTIIKLECMQPTYNQDNVRKYYDLACLHFGQNDASIWLDYIKWEMKKGDITKVHQIYDRAIKNLASECCNEFLTEYSFIKIDASQ